LFFFLMREPLIFPPFPYTTLFRSRGLRVGSPRPSRFPAIAGSGLALAVAADTRSRRSAAGTKGRRRGRANPRRRRGSRACARARSEEHTSELQSPYELVCRPLLEK